MKRRHLPLPLVCGALAWAIPFIFATLAAWAEAPPQIASFALPAGSGPHDVAPSADGGVWYTAQARGALGWLDPNNGKVIEIPLGRGSAPHGVIVGPDRAAWVTDVGLNAIVRVDPDTHAVKRFPLPAERADANLNTAAFDKRGHLWFTGQSGIYGELDPVSGKMRVFDAPGGAGPYGITATLDGSVYFASLAGSYLGRIDTASGGAAVIEPPTPRQGARRAWSDRDGRVWISEWHAGRVGRYDPGTHQWREWKLPGQNPHAYAIYVDEKGDVWLSEWSANAIVRFNPHTEKFDVYPGPRPSANVRQLLGRKGEVWAPESATDHLVRYRFGSAP